MIIANDAWSLYNDLSNKVRAAIHEVATNTIRVGEDGLSEWLFSDHKLDAIGVVDGHNEIVGLIKEDGEIKLLVNHRISFNIDSVSMYGLSINPIITVVDLIHVLENIEKYEPEF